MNLTLTLAIERSSTMSKTVFKCDECGAIREGITTFNSPEECCGGTFTEIEVEPKVQALMQHLGIEDPEEIEEESDEEYKYGRQEYMVLTDDEADEKWDEYLENYIDECVLGELPQQYRNYFDREAFKSDAKIDGRGHSLSGYDGEENEEQVEGEWYYIYRVN